MPIYTLGVPRGKIYIVNSPHLIYAIDRRPKTISFAPYVVQFAKRILAPSRRAIDALEEDLLEKNGPVGLRPETLRVMHDCLAPGEHLQAVTQAMIRAVTSLIDSEHQTKMKDEVSLFNWTRNIVTKASTDAIFGAEENPFKETAVYNGFWYVNAGITLDSQNIYVLRDIDEDFVLLGINILTAMSAPKGSRGRKLFFNAMRKYYEANGHKTASTLIKRRYEVSRKYGLSQVDIEHFNLSICYGLLVNTVPGTSWVLCYVYSNSSLLAKLREDVESLVQKENSQTITVNLHAIITGCKLLTSLVREVLRLHSTNASGRVVLEDTLLDGKYLLKKDAILLIPSAQLHSSESVWGPTASSFDPERFIKEKETSSAHKVPASAYRVFGSGASICPGRHFASNEILAILVIMLLRYDVIPTQGQWAMPKAKSHITTSIMSPVDDIKIQFSERQEVKGSKWVFCWQE